MVTRECPQCKGSGDLIFDKEGKLRGIWDDTWGSHECKACNGTGIYQPDLEAARTKARRENGFKELTLTIQRTAKKFGLDLSYEKSKEVAIKALHSLELEELENLE